MAWLVLLGSSILEAVWATALGQVRGLDTPVPLVVFLVALSASMVGLGLAAKRIPIATAYAVWTGIGAALTVTWAMATGAEPVSLLKVIFITGIIGAVAGLKLAGGNDEAAGRTEATDGSSE